MEWRAACLMSRLHEAKREAGPSYLPHRVILHGDRATVETGEGASVPESEAAKFHDWEPIFPCDTITALGNVAREKPIKPIKALGRTPFDAFLDGW